MFARYRSIFMFLFVVLFILSGCAPREVDDPALESSADLTSSSGDIDPYQLWQGEYFGTVSGLRETEMTWKDGEIHHYQFNKIGLLLGVKSWDECRGDYFDPLCVEEDKWGFSINSIGCENQATFIEVRVYLPGDINQVDNWVITDKSLKILHTVAFPFDVVIKNDDGKIQGYVETDWYIWPDDSDRPPERWTLPDLTAQKRGSGFSVCSLITPVPTEPIVLPTVPEPTPSSCPPSFRAIGDLVRLDWSDSNIQTELEGGSSLLIIPHSGVNVHLLEGPICVEGIDKDGWWQEGWLVEFNDRERSNPKATGWAVLSERDPIWPGSDGFLNQQIFISGHLYASPNPAEGSFRQIELPGELVTLVDGPLYDDNPNTGWEDVWWKIEYSGGTAWINRNLNDTIEWAQPDANLDCDEYGNQFPCIDGHGVAYSAGW